MWVNFALDRSQFANKAYGLLLDRALLKKKGFLHEADPVQLEFAEAHCVVDPGSDIRGFTVA